MAYEHRPGTFSLFKNDSDNDKAPSYKGIGKDLDGNDIEVAAWIKEGGKGEFMSCTFKVKNTAPKPPEPRRQAAQPTGSPFDSMDDDIPF